MVWKKSDKENDNVVSFANRKKANNKQKSDTDSSSQNPPHKEPLINLPLGVKAFVSLLLLIHVGLWVITQLSDENILNMAAINWGFIPARFTGDLYFLPYTILTPITYALFHGSWPHILINSVMLSAFGAGFEKSLGFKKLMIVFWGSTLIAALVHFLLDSSSISPMVGASGGISGLFAGMILLLHKAGRLSPNKKLYPTIFIFIAISIAFGLLGGPDGSSIAWAAHIGGFLGGLGITHLIFQKMQKG